LGWKDINSIEYVREKVSLTLFSLGTVFIAEDADGTGGLGGETAGVDCSMTSGQEQSEKEISRSNNGNESRLRRLMKDLWSVGKSR
jgi:hypothetical protein